MLLRSFAVAALMLSTAPLAAEPVSATTEAGVPATTTTASAPTAAPAPKERIICRTEPDIGSWVRGTRRCATAKEWKKSADAARDMTSRIQDQKGAFNQ